MGSFITHFTARMRSTKTLFVLGVVIAGAATVAITAHAARRMVPVSETIKEMIDSFAADERREQERECTGTDALGRRRYCPDAERHLAERNDEIGRAADAANARPGAERGRALDAIRRFRGGEAPGLAYASTSSNPYRDDALIETYVTDDGSYYWIDPATDVLVQAGPTQGRDPKAHPTRPEQRLPVAALRERAVALLAAQVPDFPARRSSFHPLEDNKGREIYFFRWDDFSRPARETEMPPFVQVALYADGSLASYTNTLIR